MSMRAVYNLRTAGVILLTVLGVTLTTAPAALAYEPVNIVHTERVQVGPYGMTVGFSVWPLRAMQSLDFTFIPDGGMADKSGTLTRIGPAGAPRPRTEPLVRHPRKLDVWGQDVRALKAEGSWTFRFRIDGPQGSGTGELRDLTVLPQPGPPMALSWAISTIPLIALVAFFVVAWRRTRTQMAGAALAI
jgi:hypothetical protein